MSTNKPIRVSITGAAGTIGYALVFRIASGQMTGGRPVVLQMIEIEPALKVLDAVMMELDDCAFPLLADCIATSDVKQGFRDADVALLVGARPRGKGMERSDLLQANGEIFRGQGRTLNEVASRNVKVLVVGNPANTNAMIAAENAPDLDNSCFSCMTRLDHNRALAMLAHKTGRAVKEIRKMIIWGNHSSTQFPDPLHCEAAGKPIELDRQWLNDDFIPAVQQRGARVIEARGASSAASAASAIIAHTHDWLHGTPERDWTSMGVASDGSYGIAPGVMFSYPVTTNAGEWNIVQGLELNDFERERIKITDRELREEREAVKSLLPGS